MSWPAPLYGQHLGPIHCQWQRDCLYVVGLSKTLSPGLSLHTVHSGATAWAGEKWKCYISHAVLFLPCVILTPFCTRCYAVEHENKNILPQVYQVSRHKLVSGSPQKSLFFSYLLISFDGLALIWITSSHLFGSCPVGQCFSFLFVCFLAITILQKCKVLPERKELQYVTSKTLQYASVLSCC